MRELDEWNLMLDNIKSKIELGTIQTLYTVKRNMQMGEGGRVVASRRELIGKMLD